MKDMIEEKKKWKSYMCLYCNIVFGDYFGKEETKYCPYCKEIRPVEEL
jgi:rubrerythrin